MNEALNKIIRDQSTIASSINGDLLLKHTTKITPLYLFTEVEPPFQWDKLRAFHILGCEGSRELSHLHPKKQPGWYLDDSQTWLLIIGVPQDRIEEFLSHCTKNLEQLTIRFTGLETLNLRYLTGLKILDLRHNPKLSQLDSLDNLYRLEELTLLSTAIGPTLDLHGNLELRKLSIACTQITNIPLTCPLPSLEFLDANFSPLCNSSFLQYLPALSKLHICDTHIADLEPLKHCKNLEILWAHNTAINSFPSLETHEKLIYIFLDDTPITNLDHVEFPPNLKWLSLHSCKIRNIPAGLRHLNSLHFLQLNHLTLETLPDWLSENEALNVDLENTTVEDMDSRLCNCPWKLVRQWLIERNNSNEGKPLNELKVVFLGDGGVGKSYTIARLLADGEQPESFDGNSTPGIVIKDKEYTIGDRKVQIHFWDFGGQEILHSMHRMFLTDRTLYVVLLNVRDGTQDDRARYWLHNIKSFAPKAPVLVVLNQMDENPNASINENDLKSMAPGMTETVKMSALKYTKEEFNSTFTAALLRQIGQMSETLDFFFPAAWTKVKQSLRTMKDHYIHGDAYNTICQDCGVADEGDLRKGLLKWFNDLGVSFCYGDARLEDYVILRPDWLTNAIYILLFNKMANVRNGIVPLDDIYRILRLESVDGKNVRSVLPDVTYNRDEVSYVLEVVRKFRLSFQLNDNEVFIPMLCDRNSLPIAAEYKNDSNALEFRMEYDYLPNNVLHRLMVELRGHLDTSQVWLTGARFFQESTGLSAVVKTEGNDLRIFVRSATPLHKANTYLSFIKDALDQINRDMGLAPPANIVVYKAGGTKEEFSYDLLTTSLQYNQTTVFSMKQRKPLNIEDILNQTAPVEDQAQEKLLRDIYLACASMQSQNHYWDAMEDERNDYIRNILRTKGYTVSDQSRSGVGSGGRRAGELDMDIRQESDAPWTIYEALNISGTADKSKWNEHLHKLLINYNPNGLPFLFLVSYLECSRKEFPKIADAYDEHMRWHDPKGCERVNDSFSRLNEDHGQFIRMAKCQYYCGVPTTVYHLCVRLGD